MTKKVIRIRKGKPIEVDEQVIRWRKRRRKAAQLKKARSEALRAVLSHFSGDQGVASRWLNETLLRPYKRSPAQLLKNGKTKAVLAALKRVK